MSKQELISLLMMEKISAEVRRRGRSYAKGYDKGIDLAIKLIEASEDKPQAGHAEEAPRYVRNVIARLRELPLHDREVWLKAIMAEFEQDFSHAKWREGYEQGKFEGEWVGQQLKDADKIRRELNKPVVKQFVADWYEENKDYLDYNLWNIIVDMGDKEIEQPEIAKWINVTSNAITTIVNMHQFGYEVEKEAKYTVKVKATGQCLGKYYINNEVLSPRFIYTGRNADAFTRKDLEEAGFRWVFDCPGVEVQEVE